ncbi:MAG: hypothetical protein ACI4I9_00030 [Porcipelethomonas sp.]
MNANDLNAEIARCELSIPKLANIMHISKKTLYSRMKGETAFSQPEIVMISKILNLSSDKILSIFFADSVS